MKLLEMYYSLHQVPLVEKENRRTYARLIRLERVDIIEKYDLRKLFKVDGNQK